MADGHIPRSAQGRTPLDDWLLGAAEIMLGREKGLARLDPSERGFATSFWGLALAGLVDAFVLAVRHARLDGDHAAAAWSGPGYVAASLAIAALAYLASLLALYLLARRPDHAARFTLAVTAMNWAAPIVSLGLVPFVLIAGGAGQSNGALILSLAILAALAIAGTRLVRIPFRIDLGVAVIWFVVTTLVSQVVLEGASALFGLS